MAAALLLLAVGCSGGPGKPTTLPTLTPTATPTPTPTATVSDLEAATNVVRQYYALLNQLPISMDSRGIESLMTSRCPCRQQLAAIAEARSRGEHYIDHVRLVSLTPVRDSSRQISVLVEYDADRGGLVDEHGRTVTSAAPHKAVKRLFRVTRQAGRWLISEIGSA